MKRFCVLVVLLGCESHPVECVEVSHPAIGSACPIVGNFEDRWQTVVRLARSSDCFGEDVLNLISVSRTEYEVRCQGEHDVLMGHVINDVTQTTRYALRDRSLVTCQNEQVDSVSELLTNGEDYWRGSCRDGDFCAVACVPVQ